MGAIDDLGASQRGAARLASAELTKFWNRYSGLPADQLRDALFQFMPALAEKWGDVAATAAADWYEDAKQKATGESARAVLAEVDREAVIGSTKWAAGDLYGETPIEAWKKLVPALERHVKDVGRRTVQRSAARDGYAYARVPSGAKTCAFCAMLASRGFVYGSAELAGSIDRYHDGCDCQIVPDFAMTGKEREDYDKYAAEEYEKYIDGREAAGFETATEKEIVAAMRRQNPGRYTDSTPLRPLFEPNPETWRHILFGDGDGFGGGHLFGAGVPGKTQFPEQWSQDEIDRAARVVVAHGRHKVGTDGNDIYEGLVDDVMMRVVYVDGSPSSAYPLRGVGVTKIVDGQRAEVPLQSRDKRRYNLEHE